MKYYPRPPTPPTPSVTASQPSEPLFPSPADSSGNRSRWGGRWVMFVRDYSWQLHWSVRSVRSPRGLGLWLFRISRGLQVAVQTVQRRQAQLKCVGGCKREGPKAKQVWILLEIPERFAFFLHFCMTACCILPSVFWYFWRWLGRSDASRLNSIYKTRPGDWILTAGAWAGRWRQIHLQENHRKYMPSNILRGLVTQNYLLTLAGNTADGFQHK